ncbi:MAG: hypothetical protein DMF90_01010 [Acidobacteria bacterium]|nr:MAG: hypothetical protein DMF90_01010 [Acidobacteriota bacterium]
METLRQDLIQTVRMFWRSATFTFAAVAALTLGIGTTVAVFTVVNAVLLRPAAFPDPDRLVMFMNATPQGPFPAASPAKFAHWTRLTEVIQDAAAFRTNAVNYTGGEVPEQLRAGQVSADYFRLLGAPILRGRTFTAEEDRPGGDRVLVLSHGLWTRRFGGDPAIIGRSLSINGEPYLVVGIIGPGFSVADFEVGPPPELWIPFQLDPNSRDQGHYFVAAARLRQGVMLAQARARLQASENEFRTAFPNALPPQQGFTVTPIREALVSSVRSTLWLLLGAVSFVLLIACANVANLLLVRAAARKREIAIRAAIGAGRGRLVRQLLTESVVLSLVGGGLGLLLGVIGIRALLSINTAGLPRIGQDGSLAALDWRVAAFALLVSIATGLLFGLVPALHATRASLSTALKESGRSGGTIRHTRARSLLVVGEVALAIVLLIGAALLIRTSLALGAVNPGFDPHNILTMRMSFGGPRFRTAASANQVVRDGVERLRLLPGVESASAACCVPLQGGYGLPFTIVGRPLENSPFHGGGGWVTASPGYFEVFKIPIKRGRGLNDGDDGAAPPVVVINEAMARQYWKDGDPLSDRLVIGRGIMREFADEPARQIVGVPQPRMFIPQAQVPDAANALNLRITPLAWVVRTRVEPHSMISTVQEQLRQATGLPVADVRTMEEVVSRSTSRERFNMFLMTVFGAAALLLAAIGIFGLMAYSVEQRRREIGVRLALGAAASQIRFMVLSQGLRLTLVGVAFGVASAFGLTRTMASLLFGVAARDPLVFTTIPLLLALVAIVAAWFPAGRATRVDPLTALRTE